MYTYQEPSLFSGKRGGALLAVILLHIVVGYGFYSGLARRVMQTVIQPVQIAQIDKPKQNDKPPPPPPKLQDIKPYVPPPEFVDIQAPVQQTNAITVITRTVAPPPVAAPVVHVVRTAPRMDPRHPLKIGQDWYPDASRRAGEQGTCRVRMTVAADGRIVGESLEKSSGFPRLDAACLKAVHGQRLLPATVNGKPVELTTIVPITWRLTD
ncbi:MAG TPA: energy transducer TonB [Steroidobacteraceae bacterium]|nr:energy transducer TonB [Steroidobacteraceae bacterium]